MAAALLFALVALLLPWYELGEYRPSGWQASFWIRLAVVLATLAALAARLGAPARVVLALAAATLACVLLRLALPPDFGFDFDGLAVPVGRAAGAWIGALLAVALVAAAVRPSVR